MIFTPRYEPMSSLKCLFKSVGAYFENHHCCYDDLVYCSSNCYDCLRNCFHAAVVAVDAFAAVAAVAAAVAVHHQTELVGFDRDRNLGRSVPILAGS